MATNPGKLTVIMVLVATLGATAACSADSGDPVDSSSSTSASTTPDGDSNCGSACTPPLAPAPATACSSEGDVKCDGSLLQLCSKTGSGLTWTATANACKAGAGAVCAIGERKCVAPHVQQCVGGIWQPTLDPCQAATPPPPPPPPPPAREPGCGVDNVGETRCRGNHKLEKCNKDGAWVTIQSSTC